MFTFSDDSEYRMVLVGDEQVARIASCERHQSPMHYILYNPAIVPWTQSYPIPASDTTPSSAEVAAAWCQPQTCGTSYWSGIGRWLSDTAHESTEASSV